MGDQHNNWPGRASGITTHRDEFLAVVFSGGGFILVNVARAAQ